MANYERTFAEVEAVLAGVHGIANDKRTAFQARIKNFQRLGFPDGIATSKGKATEYPPGALVDIAMAIELTQLGLPPERVITVLRDNREPLAATVSRAAEALIRVPSGFDSEVVRREPQSFYVFFDPTALDSLTDTKAKVGADAAAGSFFCVDQRQLGASIEKFTSGLTSRVACVNVTAMLDFIAPPADDIEDRKDFLVELKEWADSTLAALTST